MSEYYIGKNNERLGPFPLEKLISNGLTPDSLVWCQGMPGWKRATEVPEVAALFAPQPPAQPQPNYTVQAQSYQQSAPQPQYKQPQPQYQQSQYAKPQYQQPAYQQPQYGQPQYQQPQSYNNSIITQPNYLGWNIAITVLSLLICCNLFSLIFGIIGIIYSSGVNSAVNSGDINTAQNKSKTARIMAIIGTIILVLGILSSVILVLVSEEFRQAIMEAYREGYR